MENLTKLNIITLNLTRHNGESWNNAQRIEGCHELPNLATKSCPDLEEWDKHTRRHWQRGGHRYLEHLQMR